MRGKGGLDGEIIQQYSYLNIPDCLTFLSVRRYRERERAESTELIESPSGLPGDTVSESSSPGCMCDTATMKKFRIDSRHRSVDYPIYAKSSVLKVTIIMRTTICGIESE